MNAHELVLQKEIRRRNEQSEGEYLREYSQRLAKLPKTVRINVPPHQTPRGSPTKGHTQLAPASQTTDQETAQHAPPKVTHQLYLVPIRLDLDMDGYRLRDSLLWNLQDALLEDDTLSLSSNTSSKPYVTPEQFAEMTCRDFDLPLNLFQAAISKTIREQLQEHREAANLIANAGGAKAAFEGVRVIIKLDISVGLLQLIDRLEWDLGEETTEKLAISFAADYVRDLALPEEFRSAIAIDIIEQVCHLRRALLLVGFQRDDTTGAIRVNDPDIQTFILPPIRTTRRDPNQLNDFTPQIIELDPLELEKIELSRSREHRRRRRQIRTKRPIPTTLQSNETLAINMSNWTQISPQKTMRTPLTYRGSLHRLLSKNVDDDDDKPTTSRRRAPRR